MMTGWVAGWQRWAGRALALSALVLAAAAAPVDAQQTNDDCRCVDADGNAIADCTCFRTPSFDTMIKPLTVARPKLGISVRSDQGSEIDAQGAEVSAVLEDSPAWNAGIREGDVITAIDGQSLFEPLAGDREDDFDLDQSIPVQRLLSIAGELEPGQEVAVAYRRDGAERNATLTAEDLSLRAFGFTPGFAPGFDAERLRTQLRDLNQGLPRMRWQGAVPGDPSTTIVGGMPGMVLSRFSRYGLELVDMNAGLGQYFGTEQGVLVADVSGDSALGLEPGDVILRIGDREAQTSERVLRILSSYGPAEEIPMEIRRDGRAISVLGRLEG